MKWINTSFCRWLPYVLHNRYEGLLKCYAVVAFYRVNNSNLFSLCFINKICHIHVFILFIGFSTLYFFKYGLVISCKQPCVDRLSIRKKIETARIGTRHVRLNKFLYLMRVNCLNCEVCGILEDVHRVKNYFK